MRRFLTLLLFSVLMAWPPVMAEPPKITIIDFRVQAMYRSAKLSWEIKGDLRSPATLQIMRAEVFVDGPYKEVETITITPDKKSYEYIDKSMGAEAKYYYKLVIKETGESFGPLPTRPYFSPPAT